MGGSVLLTGAESAKALVVARALGKNGYRVLTAGRDERAPVSYSRFCARHFTTGSLKDEAQFVDALERIVLDQQVDVLLPTHSADTAVVLRHRHRLDPHCRIPFVDYPRFEQVNDKARLAALAAELGLRIPRTWTFSSAEELTEALDDIRYPAVVKLRDASGTRGLAYVHTPAELVREFSVRWAALAGAGAPIVQEYVPGAGYGTSVLYDRGELRAIFTHERLREYPSSGGSSTLRRSVRHAEMEEMATTLMGALGWHGVAMVEFKLDARSQRPVLLEVNPRMWGSIHTAIVSGVNFPVLLCELAFGREFAPVLHYEVGTTARFLLLDLLAFPGYLRRPAHPWALARSYLSASARYDIEDRSDPWAACAYYLYKCRQALGH